MRKQGMMGDASRAGSGGKEDCRIVLVLNVLECRTSLFGDIILSNCQFVIKLTE